MSKINPLLAVPPLLAALAVGGFLLAESESLLSPPEVRFDLNSRGNYAIKIFGPGDELLFEQELTYRGIPFEAAPLPPVFLPAETSSEEETSSPAPTTTSFEAISDEGVFSTLLLDLKVNGSDGPVEVAKGSRIVISWVSEGASRCHAVWSRNDITKTGTIAGRLSRSVTIRAACIDSEGNRSDDVVIVEVR